MWPQGIVLHMSLASQPTFQGSGDTGCTFAHPDTKATLGHTWPEPLGSSLLSPTQDGELFYFFLMSGSCLQEPRSCPLGQTVLWRGVCAYVCAWRHLPVSQGQLHKALAVAQGDSILARHGAQGLGRTPHYDDDGIATPILGKQVVYGVSVHRADAWGTREQSQGCLGIHCLTPRSHI